MFHFLMKYKQQGWFLVVGWSMYFFPTLETRISERKVSMGWSSTHLLSCIECVLVVGLSIRFLCYTPFFFFYNILFYTPCPLINTLWLWTTRKIKFATSRHALNEGEVESFVGLRSLKILSIANRGFDARVWWPNLSLKTFLY